MKMWFTPADGRPAFSFDMPDNAVPLEIGGSCPNCRNGKVEAIDLEAMTYACSKRRKKNAWETIPPRAFHMLESESVNGWAPVYWRDGDR